MTEQHYCLIKLDENGRRFTQLRDQLPKAKERYDKHKGTAKEADALAELHKQAVYLWDTFIAVLQLLHELDATELIDTAEKLYAAVKRFPFLTADYTKLCGALEAFEQSLPAPERNLNAQTIAHLMNRVKIGYFPTDLKHVAWMKNAIAFPAETVNVLDPCCGCGLALSSFCEDRDAVSFGAEIDGYRAEESQTRLDRVAVGSFFHSRVSHDAFHCVFLNPPYLSMLNETGGSARMEKSFLAESIPHLMPDGLLIYIIPYYRFTEDICRVLSENFSDITAWRFEGREFDRHKQAVVFGKRKKRDDGGGAAELLNRFLSPDNLPPLSEIPTGRYALPAKAKSVDCFKGAVFNVRELAAQLGKSNSLNALFDASRLEQMEKRPPLPLNVSQIGLVGGSGLMNGLVECDTPHIVKGRVVHQHKSEILGQETKGKITKSELREVTSNRMIFKVLTPAGFKSLT